MCIRDSSLIKFCIPQVETVWVFSIKNFVQNLIIFKSTEYGLKIENLAKSVPKLKLIKSCTWMNKANQLINKTGPHRTLSVVTPLWYNYTQLKTKHKHTQCESKKSPLWFSEIFSQTVGNFKAIFWHTYYTIISTLEYNFLFKYLQLWQSYAILGATS